VVELLQGKGPADLEALCLTLGAVALVGAGVVENVSEGEALLKAKLDDGSALAKFKQLVAAQGGDLSFIDDHALLPQPSRVLLLPSPESGYIADIDALKVAKSAKLAGAGRTVKDEPIHLGVGVLLRKKVGEPVKAGETLAELHAGDLDHTEAMAMLKSAFSFLPEPVTPAPLVEEISLGDVFRNVTVLNS
ncbi:MAG TPA: hypothetical protein V6C99_09235, partial [Oculatellaceae cyanobacterium]